MTDFSPVTAGDAPIFPQEYDPDGFDRPGDTPSVICGCGATAVPGPAGSILLDGVVHRGDGPCHVIQQEGEVEAPAEELHVYDSTVSGLHTALELVRAAIALRVAKREALNAQVIADRAALNAEIKTLRTDESRLRRMVAIAEDDRITE